jgi:hypothetical protein
MLAPCRAGLLYFDAVTSVFLVKAELSAARSPHLPENRSGAPRQRG